MAATNSEVWQRGIVSETATVADNIRRIVLMSPSPAKAEPGSHVDVNVIIDGAAETRSYSVVHSSTDHSALTVSVLRAPSSRGGSIYMHELEVGDSIDFTQPLQNFPMRPGAPDYLLLAGGIGITAIAHMAEVLALQDARYRLVYVGGSRKVMAYLDELADRHGDRLVVHISDEGTPLIIDDLIHSTDSGTEMYMCGPIRLMDAVRQAWLSAGRDLPNLRFETFGNSGLFDTQEFTVSIPRLSLDVTVGCHQTMLEALEDAGVDMMSDCRKGECGLCEVRVLSVDGILDHRDVFYSEQQRQQQLKLCCCVGRAAMPATTGASGILSTDQIELPRVTIDIS